MRKVPQWLFGAVVLAASTGRLAAQTAGPPIGDNQWYIGAQGGVLLFETPTQTRGAMPMVGGHLMINLRRVAFLLQVQEGFGSDETANYFETTAPAQTRQVVFNDIRMYNGMVLVLPWKSAIQPYIGAGVSIIHVVHPRPQAVLGSPAVQQIIQDYTNRVGSYGAGSFLVGLQLRVSRVAIFGQAQIWTTSPNEFINSGGVVVASGRLLQGPIHTLTAGLRIGLGSAQEDTKGGGY
ncbi:MAG: hypothetical protein ABI587_03450 [Gemmatimonadales bacterium]